MASDLPEHGHTSSLAMAKVLVTYMTDDRAIYRAIKSEFRYGLALGTIRAIRADHQRKLRRDPEEPFKLHEGYWPADASERAAATSARFLEALKREELLSDGFDPVAIEQAAKERSDAFLAALKAERRAA